MIRICYIGVGLDSSLRIEVGRSSGGVLNTDFADYSDMLHWCWVGFVTSD